MSKYDDAIKIMNERFTKDSLIAVATTESNRPYVRMVDGYYEDGAFYTVTYALSTKLNYHRLKPVGCIATESRIQAKACSKLHG